MRLRNWLRRLVRRWRRQPWPPMPSPVSGHWLAQWARDRRTE